MSADDEITPRLGRIGDRGRSSVTRVSSQIRRAAAKLAKPKRKSSFTGKRIGAGAAAGRMATWQGSRLAKLRMRRVVVKVHIARFRAGSGTGAFNAHLRYVERDGVDRDGAAGKLYDRLSDEADGRAFEERGVDDKRQFRLIIAPEDGATLDDLKENARALMACVEADLGRPLDWVAVDHFNTGHPHTHIVLRGKDAKGVDLIIAREYLINGLRARASDLVTERLGPRRDLDILRSRTSEVKQDRLTSLDRDLAGHLHDGAVRLPEQSTARDRFDHSLALQRLGHLEGLALASRDARGDWRLAPDWEAALRSLGRRDDIIRTMSAEFGAKDRPRDFEIFDPAKGQSIIGQIARVGRTDELCDGRFVLIEATDGRTWFADLGDIAGDAFPGRGAIVEIAPRSHSPRQADQTIMRIAMANGGVYSEELHRKDDPYSTPEFCKAHNRRLEALRRAGIVARSADGSWSIDNEFVDRASAFDARRSGVVQLRALSHHPVENLIEARAVTWLDDLAPEALGLTGFGAVARAAHARRLQWLRSEGLIPAEGIRLSASARTHLDRQEVSTIAATEARKSGRRFQVLAAGTPFEGAFEKTIDGAARRFAVIGHSSAFTLAPWRAELERHLSQQVSISLSAGRSAWQIAKGLER